GGGGGGGGALLPLRRRVAMPGPEYGSCSIALIRRTEYLPSLVWPITLEVKPHPADLYEGRALLRGWLGSPYAVRSATVADLQRAALGCVSPVLHRRGGRPGTGGLHHAAAAGRQDGRSRGSGLSGGLPAAVQRGLAGADRARRAERRGRVRALGRPGEWAA